MDPTSPSDEQPFEVKNETLFLKFDGPELLSHEIDVEVLAPALLAFGEMCREANRVLNGNRATVRVLLSADIRANCVTVELSVVQSFWESARTFLSGEDASSAKDILEILGLIKDNLVIPVASLVGYLLWKGRKKVEVVEERDGNVTVKVEGDNNTVTVNRKIYQVSQSSKVVENLKAVVAPVEREGIDQAEFIYENKPQLKVDKPTAKKLRESCADSDQIEPQIFTAHIVPYGPILDPRAKKWKFKLNGRVENIDISATQIAADEITRGAVGVRDTWKVKIEMTERQMANGDYKPEFKVKEVLNFTPGTIAVQQTLLAPPQTMPPVPDSDTGGSQSSAA